MYQFFTMAQFQNVHQQMTEMSYYLSHHCLTKDLFESGCQICPIFLQTFALHVWDRCLKSESWQEFWQRYFLISYLTSLQTFFFTLARLQTIYFVFPDPTNNLSPSRPCNRDVSVTIHARNSRKRFKSYLKLSG